MTIARFFTQTQNLTLRDQLSSVIGKNRPTIVHFKKNRENVNVSQLGERRNISDSFYGVKAEIKYKCKYLSIKVTLEDTFKG